MLNKYLIVCVLGITSVFSFSSLPAKDNAFDSLYKDGADWSYDESLDEKWEEAKVSIPALPDDADLIHVSIDANKTSYEHFIDKKSISVGTDGVVRYSIVLKSSNGISNVFYEGIHCSVKEYKVYATASGKKFHPMKQSKWKAINYSHYYRSDLYKNYLCDRMSDSPFKKEQIVRRIEYNDENHGWLYD
ncbi:MAG: CNP1-like family protein [Gammaproteobacteria bacterium]|nr:CNP1-like family protein [Gammaproteobacteria bacterium]